MATSVLDAVSNESSPCAGFPADTYDRYVLGLLDSAERANVDREIEQQCQVCLAGVQRSLHLWLVFAGSLEQVEPAADFRARLIRIAELSNRVLTVPKYYKRKPAILFSSLVVICLILALLLFVTFLAGRQSSHLESDRLKTQMEAMHAESVQNLLKFQDQSERLKEIQEKLNHPSAAGASYQMQELAKAQATIQQYEAQLQSYSAGVSRDQESTVANKTLLSALGKPGVKLISFKAAEGVASSAYALVINNSKIVFVGSNLQALNDHQYQLWLNRKSAERVVSLAVFSITDTVPVVITYDEDKESIADVGGLAVTVEPMKGSPAPSTPPILESVEQE